MRYNAEQIKDILKNAPSGSQFYTDGYDVKYRKVIGDKYFGYLDEAKGWVETCDKQLSQERIDKGWWLVNLIKELESQMNIDKVETQTQEEKEALDSIVSKITQDNSLAGGLASAMSNVRNAIKGNHGAIATEHQEEMIAFSGEVDWNGEGLPPVGVECEAVFVDHEHKGHGEFLILGYHSNYVWMEYVGELSNKSKHYTAKVELVKFRKPEAPQQREDRERLELVSNICEDLFGEMASQCREDVVSTIDAMVCGGWVDKTNYRKGVK
ncbi:hypothetical protein NVP1181O_34 [Vibrio phage 1.181.O._10N.286.46.C9]|nr:hypothetical protein NVP1181O_34 [Vibrio phage 1.181.O._10N.286.46.C9]